MLCEAICGLSVEVEDGRATRIVGDERDPFSRGHICPKAAALDDVRLDPDRVTEPLLKTPSGDFSPVSWERALDVAAERLGAIQDAHGPDAVALYLGNPLAHSYSALLGVLVLYLTLGTRSRYSATSLDQLPHMLASLEMFGHQALLPIPDVDRTDFLLVLGANPLVSNGSIMSTGGIGPRLSALKERGGKIVVIDPRRTETARVADRHVFIRPGTDALLLLAILQVVFAERLARPGRLARFTVGLDALERAVEPFTPEAVARVTGIDAATTRELAREYAGAKRAACYGRVGVCTQEFGGAAAWLVNAIDVVLGHMDEEGGKMFSNAAVDLVRFASMIGYKGSFGAYASRVRGLPEFGGELPAAALAEEIDTPEQAGANGRSNGRVTSRVRGLITVAGNPVLSAPNGTRLDRALSTLDAFVSIDMYVNATSRHAHVILPPTFGFERDHYDLVLYAVAARNAARHVKAIFPPRGQTRDDWEIALALSDRIARRGGTARRWGARGVCALLKRLGPRGLLELGLRAGPHRLSLAHLEREPHGIDLGPNVRSFPARLGTKDKRIRLAPARFLAEIPRLAARAKAADGAQELVLIGRRQLRSNNSWMHNSHRLVKGRDRCTLLMHPDDATARGLATGARVRVKSARGEVTVPLEVTDEMAPGVVSLPHGWGHARAGVRLSVARERAGASINDLTDEQRVDALTGTASFSGVPVEVTASPPASD
jgi:anaerobic selenocysteine-containing dehydrogenase